MEFERFNRRGVLIGASALFVASCGGEDSPAQGIIAAPKPSPTPTPTPTPTAEVFGPEVITVRQFYRPEHGNNLQPAFQSAIEAAGDTGKYKVVNDIENLQAEMWCTVRTRSSSEPHVADGMYLTALHSTHLDFRGAKFDLKGPDGGSRDQNIATFNKPWRGGWLMVPRYTGFDRLTVENVTVDGGFRGSYQTADEVNYFDKGVWLGDTIINEVSFYNSEIRNFSGEVYYGVGLNPGYQYVENCHFHGSPLNAWCPATVHKVKAVNLKASRAYQCVETLGGSGSIYERCHFYDSGNAGSVFYGGPTPDFKHATHPWWYPHWDNSQPLPVIEFRDVKFERVKFLRLSSFAHGNIEMIDGWVWFDYNIGDIQEVDLKIKSWVDKISLRAPIKFGGPPDLTTPIPNGPAKEGIYIQRPRNIRIDVECRRTEAAKSGGKYFTSGLLYTGGQVDSESIAINVSGEARRPWEMLPEAPANSSIISVSSQGYLSV